MSFFVEILFTTQENIMDAAACIKALNIEQKKFHPYSIEVLFYNRSAAYIQKFVFQLSPN
jgi:hypothetical protein